jgi:phage-related protein
LEPKFKIQFLKEAYEFLDSLDKKTKVKIIYNIHKARFSNDKELFKKLTNDIWEFRTLFNRTHYRLFAFWDKINNVDTVVISTHGIIKKTKKTPKTDIEKAQKLMTQYFKQKTYKK